MKKILGLDLGTNSIEYFPLKFYKKIAPRNAELSLSSAYSLIMKSLSKL